MEDFYEFAIGDLTDIAHLGGKGYPSRPDSSPLPFLQVGALRQGTAHPPSHPFPTGTEVLNLLTTNYPLPTI